MKKRNDIGGIELVNRSQYEVIHDTGGKFSRGNVTNKPSPTIDTNPRLFVQFNQTNQPNQTNPIQSNPIHE